MLDELSLSLALLGYTCVDLARPWASVLVATDGAQSYGFGMAVASCDPVLTRHIAAHCAEDGHGIVPKGVDTSRPSVQAVLSPMHVPIHFDDFTPRICMKAKTFADAPTLQAIAVTPATRRIMRSVQNHGLRSVVLLDSQSLLHALRKGRSSSAASKVQLQKIAALNLCADLHVVYGYIPTTCNPADPPRRGVKRKIKMHRKTSSCCSRLEERFTFLRRSLHHLKNSEACCSNFGSDSAGYDSSSSGHCMAQPSTRA